MHAVDRTLDLLYTKYTRGLIPYDGIYRVETFPVPREAMREAVINAIVHRDYAKPAATQIHDRITIRNPAELPPDWGAPTTPGILSQPHNPQVAHAFFQAGLIEAWGRGIHQIRERCSQAGNPTPLWTRESGGVLCLRFPYSEDYRGADSVARGNPGTTVGRLTLVCPPNSARNGGQLAGVAAVPVSVPQVDFEFADGGPDEDRPDVVGDGISIQSPHRRRQSWCQAGFLVGRVAGRAEPRRTG